MDQYSFRMPKTGEGWRHYKGGPDSLYTIIGMGVDEAGNPVVVYTRHRWELPQLPPIFTRKLGEFLQEIDLPQDQRIRHAEKSSKVARFVFEREIGDDNRCPFIRMRSDAGLG